MHQNLLQARPDADFRVLTVWMPMLATDARDEWDPTVLADPRVQHFWDPDRVVGQWLADARIPPDFPGPVVWDAYALFDGEGVWSDRPQGLLGAGWTVIGVGETLERELAAALG